jgi:flagellar basal body-associated protein FliL
MQEKTVKEDVKKSKHIGMIALIVIAVIAVGTSIFFYGKYQKSQNSAQVQQKKIVADISKSIELPSSTPTIVTVADKSKLSNKALAARVENKDMLLIYGSSKRIIIYRPSTQKVIDMLSFANPTEAQPESKATTQPKS